MYEKDKLFVITSNKNDHSFEIGDIVRIMYYGGKSTFKPTGVDYYVCCSPDSQRHNSAVRTDDMRPLQNKGNAPVSIISQMKQKQ